MSLNGGTAHVGRRSTGRLRLRSLVGAGGAAAAIAESPLFPMAGLTRRFRLEYLVQLAATLASPSRSRGELRRTP